MPGLLQEGPGGLRKGDGIGPQTEGKEKQQGAGDGARGDAASRALDLPCRLEAKQRPAVALPQADALGGVRTQMFGSIIGSMNHQDLSDFTGPCT